MNDYELLYMIRCASECAYKIMVDKYKPLICKKILKYKNTINEDYMQEGLIVLDKAIRTYDDRFKKSFTAYFEMILQNKFFDLLREEKRINYVIDEDACNKAYILEEEKYEYNIDKYISLLPDELKEIFKDYFINEYSIDILTKKYNTQKCNIYYQIAKIRKILKKNMVK